MSNTDHRGSSLGRGVERPGGNSPGGWFRGQANRYAAGLALVVTVVTATLPWGEGGPFSATGERYAEWYLYLISLQIVVMPLIILFCGFPLSWRGRGGFLLINLELLALIFLAKNFLLHDVLFHGTQITLRIMLVVLWIFVLLGWPVVIWKLHRRRRYGRTVPREQNTKDEYQSRPFLLGRLWFASALLLGLTELSSALFLSIDRQRNRVELPESLREPSADELRVVAVGESTMAGFPYNGRFGIPEVILWQLQQMYPARKIVVENLAKDGHNLRKAMQEINNLKIRPHLLLLYSGHNEFFYDLEEIWRDVEFSWERFDYWIDWSPTFRLFDRNLLRAEADRDLKGDSGRHLVDRNITTAKMGKFRLERFRDQLTQLALWQQRRGIPSLWFVPAGSEADFEPNRSYLSHEPTQAEREGIEQTNLAARQLTEAGKWREAAEKYKGALNRFDGFAEFHFQLGECLAATGDFEQARRHYARALDQDGYPIRMVGSYRRQVAEVAEEFQIPTVDTDKVLRPHTPHGVLDRSVFVDYVHPNLRSYYSLGLAATARIIETGLLRETGGPSVEPKAREFGQVIKAVGISPMDLAQAYSRVAAADETQRKLRYESSRLQRESRQYREWSRQLQAGGISPGENGTEALETSAEKSVSDGPPSG